MPASFRNIIDTKALGEALTSGDYSNVIKNKNKNTAKYIKGYAQETAIETLAREAGISNGLFKKAFDIEDKKLDEYDPYNTTNSKKEEFWSDRDGKAIQKEYDEDTNTFKRSLYTQDELGGYGDADFYYEDPTIPSFELFFNDESPLFSDEINKDTLLSFIDKYSTIDPNGYVNREALWEEFKKVFFKIFETSLKSKSNRNIKNKAYYINRVGGLENLNKKMINYGEDKITITLNEDVSYLVYYISELYNNLVYDYKNKKYTVPENTIRFEMTIKINDIRSFQLPNKSNGTVTYDIAKPSNIIYTLHDCNFNFFESRNYNNDIEIGGYGVAVPNSPATLSFDIYYKSVTRSSSFPLIKDSILTIDPYGDNIASNTYQETNNKTDTLPKYFDELERIKTDKTEEPKGYLNNLLAQGGQTIVNAAANYADNLETKLREIKGSAVNNLLNQFRSASNINKIEPDNVYKGSFNNRASASNAAKSAASSILNDLEDETRNLTNI
jgi:hypothetical protein